MDAAAKKKRWREKRPDDLDAEGRYQRRIRWDFRKGGGYGVCFTDADGKIRYESQPFRVPYHDIDGSALSPSRIRLNKDKLLRRAREYWNEKDKSDLSRISLDGQSDNSGD